MKAQIHGTAVVTLMVLAGCQYLPFRSASNDSTDFDFDQSVSRYQADTTSPPINENASILDRLTGGETSGIAASNKGKSSAISADLNRGNLETAKGNLETKKGNYVAANAAYVAASAAYQRVLKVDPQHATAHHRMAVIADKQRNFGTADYHYRAALRRQPNDANLLNDLGYSYFLQRRYTESERAFKRVLVAHPSHPLATSNLGRLYGTQGDYDRALAMFRRSGSEAEAQAKLAKLFPQGRATNNTITASRGTASRGAATRGALRGGVSGPRDPQRPSATTANPLTANAGSFGRAIAPSVTTNATQVATNAPNGLTRRLKEQMNRARSQSQAERQRRQASTIDSSAGQFTGRQFTGRQSRNVAPQSAYTGTRFQQQLPSQQPYTVHPSYNTQAPVASTEYGASPQTNGKWNGMHAEIDRRPLASNGGNFRAANIGTNGVGGPSVAPSRYRVQQENPQLYPAPKTPAERNPLDGMTPWPPQNSVPEFQSVQGAGLYQGAGVSSQAVNINARPHGSQTQTQGIQQTTLHMSPSVSGAPANGTISAQQRRGQPSNGAQAFPSTVGLDRQYPVNRSRRVDDAERAALMMGMNAGPGGMFPMTQSATPRPAQPTPPTRMGSASQFSKSTVQSARRLPVPGSPPANARRAQIDRAQVDTMQYQQYPSGVVQPIDHSQFNSTAPRTYPARPLENLQSFTSGASDPLQAYRDQLAEHNSVMNTMVRNLQVERQTHAVNPGVQPMSSRQYDSRPIQSPAHYPTRR